MCRGPSTRPHPTGEASRPARVPATALSRGSEIVMRHHLPARRTTEETAPGHVYRFTWRGDEITGVCPNHGPLAFYATGTPQ